MATRTNNQLREVSQSSQESPGLPSTSRCLGNPWHFQRWTNSAVILQFEHTRSSLRSLPTRGSKKKKRRKSGQPISLPFLRPTKLLTHLVLREMSLTLIVVCFCKASQMFVEFAQSEYPLGCVLFREISCSRKNS